MPALLPTCDIIYLKIKSTTDRSRAVKLPRFLANSYLTDADNSEFDYDDSDFFHSNPDDYVEHFKVIFNDYNTNVVEIQDTSTKKVQLFIKPTFEIDDYMHDDLIDYTIGGYCSGKYFDFDENERKYTEIQPFKYFNDAAEEYIESGKHKFLYLTDGFDDFMQIIPEHLGDNVGALETFDDVAEFMQSIGYERVGA